MGLRRTDAVACRTMAISVRGRVDRKNNGLASGFLSSSEDILCCGVVRVKVNLLKGNLVGFLERSNLFDS